MTLEPWEFRDPGAVVAAVLTENEHREGDASLVLVRDPSTDQEIVHTTYLPVRRTRGLNDSQREELLARSAQAMPIPVPPDLRPRHAIMTIVVRRGYAVIGPPEEKWLMAWHYSNHLVHVFTADLVVVTEHGWVDFMSGLGGLEPRLAVA